jgi:hypothetical protein
MKNKKFFDNNLHTVIKTLLQNNHRGRQYYLASMQNLFYILITAVIVMLSSCEKIIDINLDEANKKYVLEGTVTNIAGLPAEVKISQTKNFEDDNNFNGIAGATVTIQVNNATIYNLPEVSTGIYKTSSFTGTPGSAYKLLVTVNGTVFSATSVMPVQTVNLDTLTVTDLAFGGNSSKTIAPSYLDPAGLGNSYRFIQYANGVQVKKVFVQNDELSDGLRITRPMVNQDGDLKSGAVVKVEMQCIDASVYKYWYSLDQASTGNSSATPANPVSNITGGALGYFSAHSVVGKTIVIP